MSDATATTECPLCFNDTTNMTVRLLAHIKPVNQMVCDECERTCFVCAYQCLTTRGHKCPFTNQISPHCQAATQIVEEAFSWIPADYNSEMESAVDAQSDYNSEMESAVDAQSESNWEIESAADVRSDSLWEMEDPLEEILASISSFQEELAGMNQDCVVC